MSDNGAQSLKTVKDIHNDDAPVGPTDAAWVVEPILENQRTLCVSPLPWQYRQKYKWLSWTEMKETAHSLPQLNFKICANARKR